jgi:hypothetical protein
MNPEKKAYEAVAEELTSMMARIKDLLGQMQSSPRPAFLSGPKSQKNLQDAHGALAATLRELKQLRPFFCEYCEERIEEGEQCITIVIANEEVADAHPNCLMAQCCTPTRRRKKGKKR